MNQIHLKIENSDARESKKELLLVELGFLNSIKKLRDFRKIRKLEFSAKNSIKRGFKEINSELNKINEIMPSVEKSGIVRKLLREKKEPTGEEPLKEVPKAKKGKAGKKEKKDYIETQLQDIKEKLASLG